MKVIELCGVGVLDEAGGVVGKRHGHDLSQRQMLNRSPPRCPQMFDFKNRRV